MPSPRPLSALLAAALALATGCTDPAPPPDPPPPGGMARGLAPSYAPPFEAVQAPDVFTAHERLDLGAERARRQLADRLGPLVPTTRHAFTQAEGWAPVEAYYDSVLAGWDRGVLGLPAPASAAWWTQGEDAFVVVHVPATDSVAYVQVLRPRGE